MACLYFYDKADLRSFTWTKLLPELSLKTFRPCLSYIVLLHSIFSCQFLESFCRCFRIKFFKLISRMLWSWFSLVKWSTEWDFVIVYGPDIYSVSLSGLKVWHSCSTITTFPPSLLLKDWSFISCETDFLSFESTALWPCTFILKLFLLDTVLRSLSLDTVRFMSAGE